MPDRIKLTQAAVENLAPPTSGRRNVWDRTLPGFGLRVSAPRPGSREGRKTWIVMGRVNGKAVMETIGTLAQIPKVEKAREEARTRIAKMKAGTKPLDERKAAAQEREAAESAAKDAAKAAVESRFAVVADRFLVEQAEQKGWKPQYAREFRRILEHDVLPHWGERQIREITKNDVSRLLDAKASRRERTRKGLEGGAAKQANRTLTRLRTLFDWAKGKDLIHSDPTLGLRRLTKETSRDRYLTDDELVWFWRGAERTGWPFGAIFRLLLLTAQRESEVAGMRWSELDLEKRVWTIPRERTKSDRSHVVHLSGLAAEIIGVLPRLGGDCVFPTRAGTPISSFSKAKNRLDAAMTAQLREATGNDEAQLPAWVLHDLRRTATTIMARLKVPPHVADRVLNHSSGTIRGVAATYNRFEYLDDREGALDALGRLVESLVRPKTTNVVSIAVGR